MLDLLEKYKSRLRGFSGTESEYFALLLEMLNEARKINIDETIKFIYKLRRRGRAKEESSEDKAFNTLIQEIDDIVADRAKYWKDIAAHYKYFHKDIK